MHSALNGLATHVLGMEGAAILDYSDEVVALNPPTVKSIPALNQMVKTLKQGHDEAVFSIGAAMDLAREVDEAPTIQILAMRVEAHRQHKRKLTLLHLDT